MGRLEQFSTDSEAQVETLAMEQARLGENLREISVAHDDLESSSSERQTRVRAFLRDRYSSFMANIGDLAVASDAIDWEDLLLKMGVAGTKGALRRTFILAREVVGMSEPEEMAA